MKKGRQQEKFISAGTAHGTERSTFSATSEADRHTNRAGNFVGFGRYTFLGRDPARGAEGNSSAASTGLPVITPSSI